METLPLAEQYTYNFEGNAQVLDHILASPNLRSDLDRYDVVHFNSEFADQLSDHDPSVARFNRKWMWYMHHQMHYSQGMVPAGACHAVQSTESDHTHESLAC